jgi:Fe-S cluster assembly protein SufD
MTKQHDTYLADFQRFAQATAASAPAWVRDLRAAALSHFADLGFPTTRQEDWKYTNVAPIAKTAFSLAAAEGNGGVRGTLEGVNLADTAGAQLVFVNGRYAPQLSILRSLPRGVQVGSLALALRTDAREAEQYLGRYADFRSHAFVALNTAFLDDGAFVRVPPGVVVDAPLHLVFIATAGAEPLVSYPRTLIIAGPESQATIVESYAGPEHAVYFTNTVTELVAGDHAVIDHTRVQLESTAAFHTATLQVRQGDNSTVVAHAVALGGSLARNEINTALAGEGCECTLNGLYLGTGQQHLDNQTRVDHVRPRCTSRELYKGVLAGKAHCVFNGKIVVHEAAVKTDATQTNKNLLLSGDAVVDSKPHLEILNNDVRCAHGSTIGKLDQDALFYLRARGIDAEAAQRFLTYAFVSEVLNRLKTEPLRARLEERLSAQLQMIGKQQGAQ